MPTDKLTIRVLERGVQLIHEIVAVKGMHGQFGELAALRKELEKHIVAQKKQLSQWDGDFEYDDKKHEYVKHYH